MRMPRLFFMAAILALTAALSGCSQESSDIQDGYYRAEADFFDKNGWKEYISIYVSGGQIITVEYDAFNTSGFVKSWDIDYMRTMNLESGTYPNEFTRTYAVSLLNRQNPAEVDAISGATHSHAKFQMLAKATLAQAMAGNKQVALVHLSE